MRLLHRIRGWMRTRTLRRPARPDASLPADADASLAADVPSRPADPYFAALPVARRRRQAIARALARDLRGGYPLAPLDREQSR